MFNPLVDTNIIQEIDNTIFMNRNTSLLKSLADMRGSIETISDGFKIVGRCWDFITEVLVNPSVILSAVDQLSLGIVGCLLLLKFLGFDTDKWMWLAIIIKIAIMAFI